MIYFFYDISFFLHIIEGKNKFSYFKSPSNIATPTTVANTLTYKIIFDIIIFILSFLFKYLFISILYLTFYKMLTNFNKKISTNRFNFFYFISPSIKIKHLPTIFTIIKHRAMVTIIQIPPKYYII